MRAATGFGRTIDTRRRVPRRLTTEQKVSIEQTGELWQLILVARRSEAQPLRPGKGPERHAAVYEAPGVVAQGHKHEAALETRAADKGWKDFDHNQAVLNVEQMFSDGAADQRVPLTLVRSTELLGDDNA